MVKQQLYIETVLGIGLFSPPCVKYHLINTIRMTIEHHNPHLWSNSCNIWIPYRIVLPWQLALWSELCLDWKANHCNQLKGVYLTIASVNQSKKTYQPSSGAKVSSEKLLNDVFIIHSYNIQVDDKNSLLYFKMESVVGFSTV